jgi:hypothetical protein
LAILLPLMAASFRWIFLSIPIFRNPRERRPMSRIPPTTMGKRGTVLIQPVLMLFRAGDLSSSLPWRLWEEIERWSAPLNSPQVRNRSGGFFDNALRMTFSKRTGMDGFIFLGGTGGPWMILSMVSAREGLWNGSSPVRN